MVSGTILYLNGTSSAGKSSLASALQDALEQPWLALGIDTLFAALTRRYNGYGRAHELSPHAEQGVRWLLDGEGRITELAFGDYGWRMVRGFHAMVAALAKEGNNVIVDDVLFEAPMVAHCAATLAGHRAYLIRVRCPLEEVQRREQARGDRLPGLGRLLFERAELCGAYDFEVDTGRGSPAECAAKVKAYLEGQPIPAAFRRIASAAPA